MPEPIITAANLGLERGGRILVAGLELAIEPGELVLIEGANGSGKTTLLRSLAGLSQLGQSGEVVRHCRRLLYLGHRAGVKQLLTARENLVFFCKSQGLDTAGIDAALDRVGLYGYEDVLCQNMSAGQARRVNLARLYLSDAELWLLDEPFTAIDREGVMDLARTLVARAEAGGAVVFTSHQDMPLDYPLRRVRLGEAP